MIQTHFLKFISEYCANSWPTFWGDMLPVVETHLQCIFLNIILHKKINNYSNNINSCRKNKVYKSRTTQNNLYTNQNWAAKPKGK